MRQTYANIDLAAYRHNVHALREHLGPGVRLMAVVKANAYGHGLVPIARAAQDARVDYLAVALAEEGILLREAGVTLPILVLAGLNAQSTADAVANRLTLTVFTPEHLKAASVAAEQAGLQAVVHLKMDTGMNRIGVKTAAEVRQMLKALASYKAIHLEGAYTHFACADSPDPAMTSQQLARFHALAVSLPKGLILHTSGSSALLNRPDARLNMVRAGIALYGYSPVPTQVPLQRVLSWVAEITHVKEIAAGETVSYGATVTAKNAMKVATLAVGYGDGYQRVLSNLADVLVQGKRCKVLGRVCMDQVMVDVSQAGPVAAGDQAILIGQDGAEAVTAQELADLAGTIPYETLLSISGRVPRVYLNEACQEN